MKSFFQTRKPDKPADAPAPPPKPNSKAYKIWIPPTAQSSKEQTRPLKVSRTLENAEAKAKASVDAGKQSRRTAVQPGYSVPATSSSSTKLHKSHSIIPTIGPSAVNSGPQNPKPSHITTAPRSYANGDSSTTPYPTPGPAGPSNAPEPAQQSRQHTMSMPTPVPASQYASLPSSKPSRQGNGHSRSRTIPNTTQPDFWIPPVSQDPSSSVPQKDRSGEKVSAHSRSRTDPSTTTTKPQTWLAEPSTSTSKRYKEKDTPGPDAHEAIPVTRSHRSHKDTESIRRVERSEKSRRPEERDKERERERRKDDGDRYRERKPRSESERPSKHDAERESRRRAERSAQESMNRQAEREREKKRRHTEDKDRERRQAEDREKERRYAEERQKFLISLERDKPRAVPVPSKSYDENESSDSARPKKYETSSRYRRHRTDDVASKEPFPSSMPPPSIYEAPIRPIESPILASLQAPSLDYQIVMVDSDSTQSKKEKHRHRAQDSSSVRHVVVDSAPQRSNGIHATLLAVDTSDTPRSALPHASSSNPIRGTYTSTSSQQPTMSSHPLRNEAKHPPPVVSQMERFVPAPNYSSSSREVTPRRDDSSSLEVPSRHERGQTPASLREASSRSLPPSSTPIVGSSPQNGLNVSPAQLSRDSPLSKSSPGKRSLQDKVQVEFPSEKTPESQPVVATLPGPSPSTSNQKSSPSRREPDGGYISHANGKGNNDGSLRTRESPNRMSASVDISPQYELQRPGSTQPVMNHERPTMNPPMNADFTNRTSNMAIGATLHRSSTAMGTRPAETSSRNGFPPPIYNQQHSSFPSNNAIGAGIYRPSTAAGFSQSQPAPAFDSKMLDGKLSRMAGNDSLRERFAQKPSYSRPPLVSSQSGSGSTDTFIAMPAVVRPPTHIPPISIPSVQVPPIIPPPLARPITQPSSQPVPRERHRTDSNNSLPRQSIPSKEGYSSDTSNSHSRQPLHQSHAPPDPRPSSTAPQIPQQRSDHRNGGAPDPSNIQSNVERPIPPRDMSTPKQAYRHPVLMDLLTSPTNNTKYVAGQSQFQRPDDLYRTSNTVSGPNAPVTQSYQPNANLSDGVVGRSIMNNQGDSRVTNATEQKQPKADPVWERPQPPSAVAPSSYVTQYTLPADQPNARLGTTPGFTERKGSEPMERPSAKESATASHNMAPDMSRTISFAVHMPVQPFPPSTKYTSASEAAILHSQHLATESARQKPANEGASKTNQAQPYGYARQQVHEAEPTTNGQSAPATSTPFIPPYRPTTTVNEPHASRPTPAPESNTVISPSQDRPPFYSHNSSSQQAGVPPLLSTSQASHSLLTTQVSNPSSSKPSTNQVKNDYTEPTSMARTSSHDSVMKTPSSLAPSVLKKSSSRTSLHPSTSSQNHESRKKGFLNIFRSKVQGGREQSEPSTLAPQTLQPEGGRVEELRRSASPSRASLASKVQVPPPASGTTNPPIQQGNHAGGGHASAFSPFKYLTSKRHRTVSGASLEAVNGTATNTVVGSPTASMLSSNPVQPPSVRDPNTATKEWREREGGRNRNGKLRVMRPGVVFELRDEPPEDKPRLRSNRKR